MKKHVMQKNLLRTIQGSIGRFVAIMGIIALGASIFVGLLATKADMVATGNKYMAQLNMFDLRLISTYGWTQSDVDAVAQMAGIRAAEGMISLDALVGQAGSDDDSVYKLHNISQNVNQVNLVGGRMPQRPNECLVDEKFVDDSVLGTKIVITANNSQQTLDSLVTDTFTVVGYCSSPLYMDMSRGSTSIGNGTVSSFLYLPNEAFAMDYFTEIAVCLQEQPELYSQAYSTLLETMAQQLEPQALILANGRMATLKAEAEESYWEGYREYEDGLAEFEKGKQDALQQLQEALQKLEDGQAEIDENRAQLTQALEQLQQAQQQLDEQAAQLVTGQKELAEAKAEAYAALAAASAELMENYKVVIQNLRQVNDGLAQLDDGLAQMDDGIAQLQAGLPELESGLEQLELAITLKQVQVTGLEGLLELAKASLIPNEALVAELESQLATAKAELEGYESQKVELQNMQVTYSAQLEQLLVQREELVAQRKELAAAKKTLDDAMATIEDGMLELNSQQIQAENQFAAAEAELESGRIQLETAQQTIDEAKAEAEAGVEALDLAQETLDAGFAEYAQGKLEAEQALADAQAELDEAYAQLMDARQQIDDMADAQVFTLDRNTNMGYLAVDSNSDIVAGVSRVFPAFFLLVAALVCITTMTRMVEEERTQIGTFKALGYGNATIIGKYLIYAGFAAVVGCGLGTVIGSLVFPAILWEIYGLLLDIPTPVVLAIDWPLCLAVVSAYTAVMLLVTWYCCRRTLKEVPAELIRPRAPTTGKKIFLEYLFFWKKISFLNKVMLRNVFRYRQRMLMMLIGIGGCTGLLLTGFGLRDSIVNTVPDQYGQVTVYDLEVYFSQGQDAAAQEAFCDAVYEEGGIAQLYYQASMEMQYDGGYKEINVLVSDAGLENYIHFKQDGQTLAYPNVNEALISVGAANQMGVEVGDRIRLRSTDMQMVEVTVTGIYHNNVYNYVILSPETLEAQWGSAPLPQMAVINVPDYVDTHICSANVSALADVINVLVIEDMAHQVSTMLEALDTIVVIIVICAGALAAIVLYNLTNINITERIREIATIKVLGFRAGETAAYVFKENLLLSGIGTVVGLGMGYWLLRFVISQIKVDMIWLTAKILPISCVICVALTMVFAVIVDFLLYFKLEKINMAEALKSVE